jgi:hypothetical protein
MPKKKKINKNTKTYNKQSLKQAVLGVLVTIPKNL